MRIGFQVHYRVDEITRAAARLADFARSLGHDVAFHTPSHRVPQVHPTWDGVVETDDDRPFASWVRDVQTVVVMEPLTPRHFTAAAKAGCKTVVFAPWTMIAESMGECYKMADEVVSPIKQGVPLLVEQWGLTTCRYVPWDNGLPATRKADAVDPGRTRVLVPLHVGVVPGEILNVVWRLLRQCPFVDVVMLSDPRRFSTAIAKAVGRIQRTFEASGQFRVVNVRKTPGEELSHYGRSDLVVWASEFEGMATVGLDAVSMGTPVIAYDVAPQNEFLHDRKNAVLVPCDLEYNWLGVPTVKQNLEEFESHLVALVGQPKTLSDMRRFTRYGMATRREKFTAGWKKAMAAA